MATSSQIFALFKNNGPAGAWVEIPHTRFTAYPPVILGASPLPPQPFSIVLSQLPGFGELVGNTTLTITQNEIDTGTGDIEIRAISLLYPSISGPDVGGTPTSVTRVSLNFEKVG